MYFPLSSNGVKLLQFAIVEAMVNHLCNCFVFPIIGVPLLFSTVHAVVDCSYYTTYHISNDELKLINFLGEYDAASLLTCAGLCTGDICRCYGYNTQAKSCRLYSECSFNMTSSDGDWKYHTFDKYDQRQTATKSTDCLGYYQRNVTTSGIYFIQPYENNCLPVQVYCDMETSGGGWTVMQSRHNGSVDFRRNWKEYKEGFGSVSNEHWLGNDIIHQLTKNNDTCIYFSITLTNGSTLYQEYDRFSISDELDSYRLFLRKPTHGSLGDRLIDTGVSSNNVVGMKFSTIGLHNCADDFGAGGGWWYNSCHDAYLNGPYKSTSWKQPWDPPLQTGIDISRTKMMIRKC